MNLVQLRRRLLTTLSRCAKACFCEGDGETLTYEGDRLLADLRSFAKLEGRDPRNHAFLRDATFRLDPLAMARIEGRREVIWRLQRLLNLDEQAIQRLVEVKDE